MRKQADSKSFLSAPEAQRQARLQWLVIPMGFPTVLRHVERHIEFSVWLNLFNSAVPAEHGWTLDLRTADGLFAEFLGEWNEHAGAMDRVAYCGIDLCDITLECDRDENPYENALMDLFALFQIEHLSMRDMAQVVAFMSRLNGDFQVLLVALDSRALLILLYWLAILDSLGLWWAKSRITQEARAILECLELNEDVRIQSLLKVPRTAFKR